MDTRKRERYSLRSECRDHGSCSCRNALDSMPASTRRTSRRTRRSSESHKELMECDDNSDYGSISPDENNHQYLSPRLRSKSKEIVSDSSDFEYDSDSSSIIVENFHTFTSRSIKRVTFSDIIDYNGSNKEISGGYNSVSITNTKTGTPKKSLSGEVKMKPRTILVTNNNSHEHDHSSINANGMTSHYNGHLIPISSDTFESRRRLSSCNSSSVAGGSGGGEVGVVAAGTGRMTTISRSRSPSSSSSSSSSWGETACRILRIIGFPVYYLLMVAIIAEKWFLEMCRNQWARWWLFFWGDQSVVKKSSSSSLRMISRNGRTAAVNNGNGYGYGYKQNSMSAASSRYGSAVNVNGFNVGNSLISDDDDEDYKTCTQKSNLNLKSMAEESTNNLNLNNKYSTPPVVAAAATVTTRRNKSLRTKILTTATSNNVLQGQMSSTIRSHHQASSVGNIGKALPSDSGEDNNEDSGNFMLKNSWNNQRNNLSANVSNKKRVGLQGTSIGSNSTSRNIVAIRHDVDSYDEDEDEYSASAYGSSVTGGAGTGRGMRFWGFIIRVFIILVLTGALVALVIWLWPVAASVASETWAFVYSLFVSAWEVVSNVSSVIISSIPLLFTSGKSESISQVPVQNPAVSGYSGISVEDYNTILKQIEAIQVTLKSHEDKILLQETNFKTLREQIVQLQAWMKEVSLKDKSTEQIVAEVMKVPLGVSSDGESVTFENLIEFIRKEGVLHRKNLEMNLNTLSARIDDAQMSQAEKINELNIEVNSVLQSQKELAYELDHIKDRSVDVDVEQIKAAILPGLMSEIETQVKISCETRDCPESLVAAGGHLNTPGGVTEAEVEKLIHVALSKYDSDKTGMPDLALEPAGGSILSTRCTKSSKLRNSVVSLWGFKIWSPPNNPRTIIQPGVVPGECWAFEGSIGDVVIKLISPSIITGFTMEHIPKSISPYRNIESAPKEFQVLGLNDENELETAHDFGTFVYEDNDQPLQYFDAVNITETAYPIVELKIKSNHGNLLHTCLYRFRVHGTLVVGGAPFTATVQTEETM